MIAKIIRGPWTEPEATEILAYEQDPEPTGDDQAASAAPTAPSPENSPRGTQPHVEKDRTPQTARQGPKIETWEKAMAGDQTHQASQPLPGGTRNGGTALIGRILLTTAIVGIATTIGALAGPAWGILSGFLILAAWGWVVEIRDRRNPPPEGK